MISPLSLRVGNNPQPIVSLSGTQQRALALFWRKLKAGIYALEPAKCLCGNSAGMLLARVDRYGLPVHTHLCRSTGMMWTSPRMTPCSLEQFYREDYRELYAGDDQASDKFFLEQIQHGAVMYDLITKVAGRIAGIVFEVGCGAGGALIPFARAGWQVRGCDLNGKYLERGRAEGLVLDEGDWTVLARHGRANVVILRHVLEHLPEPHLFLVRLRDLLVKGGYVYLELPGIFSIHRTYGDTLLFLQNAHVYHFSLGTLRWLMDSVGFGLVRGDEGICALFQEGQRHWEQRPGRRHYYRVLSYLWLVEVLRVFHVWPLLYGARARLRLCAHRLLGDVRVNALKQALTW